MAYYRPITLMSIAESASPVKAVQMTLMVQCSRPVLRVSSLSEPFSYKLSRITEVVLSRSGKSGPKGQVAL